MVKIINLSNNFFRPLKKKKFHKKYKYKNQKNIYMIQYIKHVFKNKLINV